MTLKSIGGRLALKKDAIGRGKNPALHAAEIANNIIYGDSKSNKDTILASYNETKKEIIFSVSSANTKTTILLQAQEIRSMLHERGINVKSIKVH